MNADLASIVPEPFVAWCQKLGQEGAALLCAGAAETLVAGLTHTPKPWAYATTGAKMARKPNYNFERQERERQKAEKKAKRLAEKKEAREAKSQQNETSAEPDSQHPGSPSTE